MLIGRTAALNGAALLRNTALLGGETPDLRADAYGHGIALIAPLLRNHGLTQVLVSHQRDAELAESAGLNAQIATPDAPTGTGADILYGFNGRSEPVMELSAELIAVKKIGGGEGVSYGYTYRTEQETTLGLIALGYADGLPRAASSRGSVSIAGTLYPLAGRIAMDQFMVDLGGSSLSAGERVILFGGDSELTVAHWEQWSGFPSAAVTARLGSRVQRVLQ